ncbi:MAG: ABC transporter permease [Firmicutes bacterium]|nr:ABC transporter permease [Bacillota bacterium]
MLWKLAILNVSRRKGAAANAVIVTAIAVLAAVLVSLLSMGIRSGLAISAMRMGADVIIYPKDAEISDAEFLYSGIPQMVYMDASVIDGKLPQQYIEHITPQFFLKTLPAASCCATDEEFRIVGIDKESDFIVAPWHNVEMLHAEDMLVGAHNGSLRPNIKVLLLGNTFKVVDKIAETGSAIDQSVFIDIDEARKIAAERFTQDDFHYFEKGQHLDNLVTCYLIKLNDQISPDDFVAAVKDTGIDAQIASISAARSQLSDELNDLAKILFAFTAAIILLGCLALYAQYVNLTGKMQREIGYMRSVGLRKRDVFFSVFLQVCLMGGIGGLIGGVLAVLLLNPAVRFLQEVLVLPVSRLGFGGAVLAVLSGVVLALLISLVSSLAPIVRSVGKDPAKAVTEGEY